MDKSLPRKSFARKIVGMIGYSVEQEIIEVASIDGVDREEAVRRIAKAKEHRMKRSIAQRVRWHKTKAKIEDARRTVLLIAYHRGPFLCADEMENIACIAGWKAPTGSPFYWDTGRVFREICRPLEKLGLLHEFCNDDERFVGYTITEKGRKYLLNDL